MNMRLVIIVLLMGSAWPLLAQTERNVTFKNRNTILSGTLTLPVKQGVHPAVIITLGSGSLNRDGEIDGLKPFKLMATELARNGFVVLRYDNRSKGLSRGKAIEQSTTRELAQDAQAAFNYLRNQKAVNKRRIGFIGHSEGATIAAIATVMNPETKFLISINGPTLTGFEDILLNAEQRLRKAGNPRDTIQYYLNNLATYLGKPASTSLGKRKVAARKIILFEVSQLTVKQREKITEQEIQASVNSQMREVLSRWEQEYLVLNPAAYYKKASCSASLLFSDSELEGVLTKRLTVVKKILDETNRRYTIKVIRNVDHNLINTDSAASQHAQTVSLEFIKSVVEEAKKNS